MTALEVRTRGILKQRNLIRRRDKEETKAGGERETWKKNPGKEDQVESKVGSWH